MITESWLSQGPGAGTSRSNANGDVLPETGAVGRTMPLGPAEPAPEVVSLLPRHGRYAPGVHGQEALPGRILTPRSVLNGRYRVVRQLGSGSFGRVYLAQDLSDPLEGRVAIKELPADQFRDAAERAEAVAWFQREASTLLTLQHPAIPSVHGFWTARADGGPLYLAMDYIPGDTMAVILAAARTAAPTGACPWRSVIGWGVALCDVLSYLHGRAPAFVFRDLKLSNVILDDRTDRPVLIDFGIARHLADAGATTIGTWGYAPYEQVVGQATPRSDIYALGALLHALVTGREPDVAYAQLVREGRDMVSAMRTLFPPADCLAPEVPPALAQVLTRATAFDPRERYPDAAALAAALRSVLDSPLHTGSGALQSTGRDLPPAEPHTLRVSLLGDQAFTSIAQALRHARTGMRIEVFPGAYHESLVIDRQVDLVGVGPRSGVVIEGLEGPCLSVRTKAATIRGLTLRGAPLHGRKSHPVVDIARGRAVLEDCAILGGAQSCISVHGPDANPLIRRCVIRQGAGAGVRFADMAVGVVEECEISGSAVGVEVVHYASPVIRRSAIYRHLSYGVHAADYAEGNVEACEITHNGQAGVCIDWGSALHVCGCRVSENDRGVVVAATGGGSIEDCDLQGNTLGAWLVPAEAAPLLRAVHNRTA